ncbi:hypothetical protein MSG28_005674 [Choristoneura fumiferana]|uniref:Uncharacterized protein n=1 Tax=Choristoneura fumiferana TaxID=7141 RepID=A0ACC0KZV1_CHOFU|nr:hypothetical protein MSG28_005674 [Choristoneura fumiferana]
MQAASNRGNCRRSMGEAYVQQISAAHATTPRSDGHLDRLSYLWLSSHLKMSATFPMNEELENLRTKLDKVETERTHYKSENERLETKNCCFFSNGRWTEAARRAAQPETCTVRSITHTI